MLFLVFGSSAAGKTSALAALRGRVDRLAVHDFDEVGVPWDADTAWRHRANERWVERALALQADGIDLLLAGQTPPGELIAAPSAARLEGVSACLLDCDDETRGVRLQTRGSAQPLERVLAWAAWLRRHAADPSFRLDVIRHSATDEEQRWERLTDLPAWRVPVVDTSALPVEEVAARLAAWIEAERARVS